MTNNKWIVPIVAIVLCAVSLIGAGYAAYTATLSDTETATYENDYVVLEVGTHTIGDSIIVEYDSQTTSANGTTSGTVYSGVESTEILLNFKLTATHTGEHNNETDTITLTSITLSDAGSLEDYFTNVNVYVYNGDTQLAAGDALNTSTTYTVKLVLDTPKDCEDAPGASDDVEYVLVFSDALTDATKDAWITV